MLPSGHDVTVAFAGLTLEMRLELLEFVGDHPIMRGFTRCRYVLFTCTLFGLGACHNRLWGGFLEVLIRKALEI